MGADRGSRAPAARPLRKGFALGMILVAFLLGMGMGSFLFGGRVAAWVLDLGAGRPGKAWVHGVRSPEGAREAAARRGGFEVDVVLQLPAGRWKIWHPPSPPSAHDLPAILAAAGEGGAAVAWIDFRNLGEVDPEEAAARLVALVAESGMEVGRVIVESPEAERLAPFARAGFATAFYLPLDPGHASRHEAEAVEATLRGLAVRAEAAGVTYVTSSLSNQALLRRGFPGWPRLLWWSEPGGPRGVFLAARDLVAARGDPEVRGVLLRSGSP